MKALERISTVPTIDVVFGSNPALCRVIKKHFDSIVPILLVSRQYLLNLDGIGHMRAMEIERLLRQAGLRQRDFSENTELFINALFGSIEEASVHALQVTFDVAEGVVFTSYHRLTVVTQLAQIEPEMSVNDVLKLSTDDVEALLSKHFAYDKDHLRARLSELELRLRTWGKSLAPCEAIRQLRAVI